MKYYLGAYVKLGYYSDRTHTKPTVPITTLSGGSNREGMV